MQHRIWFPLLMLGAARPGFAASPDFDRDIRPILSDKCFHCHGPDGGTRQAELRLDSREAAVDRVIVPGKPEESELIARIFSDDDSQRMPPAESHLALSEEQKELIRQWIADGAEYREHWSFRALPAAVDVPTVNDKAWPRGEIDRFVHARLEAEKLAPTPRADGLRLLRRMTLDLTGLPPTLAEIEAFETSAAADMDAALASTADRLLASPGFGEHFAVAWLDAARYADSFGYQSDQLNTQWPYRDWVVQAFNENLPYDQFLTWQLAGDLLPNATRDQRLATAFNRMHRMTGEGGSIAEEWLAENAADRVNTFGAAMLGLTLECARCHDHKYDPISARDYYAISAFFNSIDENGMYDHTAKVPSPTLMLPTEEQEARLDAAKAGMRDAEAALAATIAGGESRFEAWLAAQSSLPSKGGVRGGITKTNESQDSLAPESPAENPSPSLSPRGRGMTADCVGLFQFEGDLASVVNSLPGQTAGGIGAGLASVAGVSGRAVAFDGDRGVVFPELMKVDRWDAFTLDFHLKDEARSPQSVVVLQRTAGTDVGYNGFDLMIADGVLSARLYRVWPGNGIGVEATEAIPAGEWRHVAVTYDGSSRARGLTLYLDGRELPTRILRDKMQKSASVVTFGAGHFTLGERLRDRGFQGGAIDELRVYTRAVTPLEIAELHSPGAVDRALEAREQYREQLQDYYFSAIDEPARTQALAVGAARHAFVAIEDEVHEVSVMEELPVPRPTYILARGAYDAPKSEANRVERDTLEAALPAFPAGAPRNRLGLARWLTDPAHPLTARVVVNRVWANFFGRGLVGTADNFGRQGEAPSHPELLDWLARDFVSHGWDVKRLCRQIVLSATYQQGSRAAAELRERDPENRLLARGPARRLSAEQIRDLALAASGLLSPVRGGPPAYPYQPGGNLWQESNVMSPPYVQSTGEALRRRSLYSVWKRTVPLPNMMIFDATTRETCAIGRSRTNTPLQSLVLLNDVQFVEACRALADAALERREAAGSAEKLSSEDGPIDFSFLRLAGRRPTPAERALLQDLYDDQLAAFQETARLAIDKRHAAKLRGVLVEGAAWLTRIESRHASWRAIQGSSDWLQAQAQALDALIANDATRPDFLSLIAVGELPASPGGRRPELAAMTVVCQTILSLDATIQER